jgi:hypothetical protein
VDTKQGKKLEMVTLKRRVDSNQVYLSVIVLEIVEIVNSCTSTISVSIRLDRTWYFQFLNSLP